MAVAVKSDAAHLSRTFEAARHAVEREGDDAFPGIGDVRRNEAVR